MAVKTVVLNAQRMNYDGKLDLSILSDQVVEYAATESDELLPRIADATIVVTKEMPITPEQMAQFPDSVKLLCEAGTGYNNIPLEAARQKGITVCNIPAYSSQRVAHTAIMFILNLSSTMQVQQAMLTRGDRTNFTQHMQVNHGEVNGKTLGIIGAGNIGREVIKIATALDMNILVYTRTPKADEGNVRYVSMEQVVAESDYLSLHCPLNDSTRHLVDEKVLAQMKPTAFLVNTSRGGLVDEGALIAALQNGVIAGAALDVQEVEPPVADNPLYTMSNVILTPHMGWRGLETRGRMVAMVADNIKAFCAGKPTNVVS